MPGQVFADRVQETTATAGTGTVNLGGAVSGYQDFLSAVGTTNTCDYLLVSGSAWETGQGTVTSGSPNTLSRDTVFASSAAGGKITLAGTSNVYLTFSAYRYGRFVLGSKASNYAVLASDSGTHFDNSGAVGSVNFALPAAASLLRFAFGIVAAQAVTITANGTDKIAVAGINSAAGGVLSGATPFWFVWVECHQAGQWIASNMMGGWSVT